MKKPQKKVRGTTPTVVPNNGAACADASEPLLFYMPDATYGELCQWFPASFAVSKAEMTSLIGSPIDDNDDNTEDNMTFNCAEQFMMYCKAGRFDDKATQRRILATDSPKEQKRLGGLVAGFKASSWDEVKSTVVVAGNMAKFGQNPKLRGKLLASGDRLLAEAASRDRVWGIGYTAKHAMSFRSKWGENRLERALMVVRECLREEQKGEGAGSYYRYHDCSPAPRARRQLEDVSFQDDSAPNAPTSGWENSGYTLHDHCARHPIIQVRSCLPYNTLIHPLATGKVSL